MKRLEPRLVARDFRGRAHTYAHTLGARIAAIRRRARAYAKSRDRAQCHGRRSLPSGGAERARFLRGPVSAGAIPPRLARAIPLKCLGDAKQFILSRTRAEPGRGTLDCFISAARARENGLIVLGWDNGARRTGEKTAARCEIAIHRSALTFAAKNCRAALPGLPLRGRLPLWVAGQRDSGTRALHFARRLRD